MNRLHQDRTRLAHPIHGGTQDRIAEHLEMHEHKRRTIVGFPTEAEMPCETCNLARERANA
jgi:hypothetical protein